MSMVDLQIRSIGTHRAVIGEGPVWSVRDQALYWLDNTQKKLLRHLPASGSVEIRDLQYKTSCLALLGDGRLLVAFKKGLATVDFASGVAQPLALAGEAPDFGAALFNDGKVDRAGRLWIGTLDKVPDAARGALYCIDPALRVTRAVAGVKVSNGLAWSPDGRTLYHVDTRPGCIYAMDFDAASATVSNRRPLITYDGGHGRPDGCTVDAEGYLWVAEIEASRVSRYAPDGRKDREILLPITKPTSVMFGGPDLATLFITSMTFRLDAAELERQPWAGTLLALEPGVRGIAEPVFGLV